MTELLILRHGPTQWNAEKRLQGRSDIPLSEDGRNEVSAWSVPPEFQTFEWVSSPLLRALETTRILGHELRAEPALVEMSWGDWEGVVWQQLLQANNPELDANRARGLDFRPQNGESPREVQQRLQPWLLSLSNPTIAVCHKGVLQAIYALATGWQMTDKAPDKILPASAHLFEIEQGVPVVRRLNIPLKGRQ